MRRRSPVLLLSHLELEAEDPSLPPTVIPVDDPHMVLTPDVILHALAARVTVTNTSITEPQSYKQAIASRERVEWDIAIND